MTYSCALSSVNSCISEILCFFFFSAERGKKERPIILQRVFFHKAMPGLGRPIARGPYQRLVAEKPIDRFVDAPLVLDTNAYGAKAYRTLPYRTTFESLKRNEVQYANCVWLPGHPVKLVVDCDAKKIDIPRLNPWDVVDFLAERLGASPDHDKWRVLWTPRTDDWSYHLICDNNTHYSSVEAIKQHLLENASIAELAAHGIDMKIYATWKSLRVFGCSKFEDWQLHPIPRSKWVNGPTLAEMTFEQYLTCIPTYVGPYSVLTGPRNVAVAVRRPNFDNFNQYPHMREILSFFEDIGNDVVEPSAFDNTVGPHMLKFDLDDCHQCPVALHRDQGTIYCVVNTQTDVCRVFCRKSDCAEYSFGVTPKAVRFEAQRKYMNWLDKHGLCRADMILFHTTPGMRSFGKYGLTPEQFFKDIREANCDCSFCKNPHMTLPKEFCEFDPPKDAGPLISVEFFNFLRDSRRENQTELGRYIRLFVAHSTTNNKIYFRGTDKLETVTKEWFTTEMDKFQYDTYKPGRGKDAEEVKTFQPVLKFYTKWPEFKSIMEVNYATFKLNRTAPLNMMAPMGVDLNHAREAWKNCDPADAEMLRRLWGTYLEMLTEYEPRENGHNIKCRDLVQRFFQHVFMQFGKMAGVMLVMISDGKGQGKSTMAYTIQPIVGEQYYNEAGSLKKFVNQEFNYGSNGFNNFDEIKINKEDEDGVKRWVTTPWTNVKRKYHDPRHEPSMNTGLGTSNNTDDFPVTDEERRYILLKLLPKATLEERGMFNYKCLFCPVRRNEDGDQLFCRHAFNSHATFIALYYESIVDKGAPLLLPFVGMHCELWENSPDQSSLQSRMLKFMTQTTAEMLQSVGSDTSQVMDEWLTRKCHWSPFNPPAVGSIQLHRACDVIRLGEKQNAVWERLVPVNTLYDTFKADCVKIGIKHDKVITKQLFLNQLTSISLLRRKKNIEYVNDEPCDRLIYSRDTYEPVPTWKNQEHRLPARCIDMGTMESWARVRPVLGPSERRDMLRSESMKDFASRQSSSSVFSDSPIEDSPVEDSPAAYEPEPDTRDVREEGVRLQQLYREALDADNAREAQIAKKRGRDEAERRQGREPEDEPVVDLDKRAKLKSKFIARVEEGDEEEEEPEKEPSGENLMDESD